MCGVENPRCNKSPASLLALVAGAPLVPPPTPPPPWQLHRLTMMRMEPRFLAGHLGLASYLGGCSSEFDLGGVETNVNWN